MFFFFFPRSSCHFVTFVIISTILSWLLWDCSPPEASLILSFSLSSLHCVFYTVTILNLSPALDGLPGLSLNLAHMLSAWRTLGPTLHLFLPLVWLGLVNGLFILQNLAQIFLSRNFVLSSVTAFTLLYSHLSVYLTPASSLWISCSRAEQQQLPDLFAILHNRSRAHWVHKGNVSGDMNLKLCVCVMIGVFATL